MPFSFISYFSFLLFFFLFIFIHIESGRILGIGVQTKRDNCMFIEGAKRSVTGGIVLLFNFFKTASALSRD